MEEVADAVGVSHMDMLAYEQERIVPPDAVVAAVAHHTEMLVGFFEWDHARLPVGDIFFCPPPKDIGRCTTPDCREFVEAVCDFPVGNGKTCDLGMCLDHRVMVEEGVDICAFHRKFIVSPLDARSRRKRR